MLKEFDELSYYTLAHIDTDYFIHQHIVDAFQAQSADDMTKPIALTFSLIGLYLYLEKGYTGKQIQQAHAKLAQNKQVWPKIEPPTLRGNITAADVMKAQAGPDRDLIIRDWCESVWNAYGVFHATIFNLVHEYIDK